MSASKKIEEAQEHIRVAEKRFVELRAIYRLLAERLAKVTNKFPI